ncbi:hypothetical protein F4824DRAFT_444333 [Ustulina deusta]|nr:hypothetical protein F4824DRAFT_444333 [Ustulina deusta]
MMEAMATTTTIYPASNLSGGSPVMAGEASQTQTPEPGTAQHQPFETVPDGVHIDGVDNKGRTPPPSAAPVPELVQPPASQPPSARPSFVQTQPPSQQPSRQSSRQSSQQPQPQAIQTTALHGQSPYSTNSPTPQSHQHYRRSPSTVVPPSSAPFPSQAGQPQQQHQDMNKTPQRFPSPDFDHKTQIPKFNRDLSLVADAVQQSCPEAVRRIVRDKWEKCIMGSEFHHAFIMNAIIHHASGVIMRRAIRDFGQNLVAEAKHEIASHLRPQDLDDIAPVILTKCSDQFLDKALEQRLKSIDARSLINALARAERLGYENSDILEDRPERVVPATQMHEPGVTQVNLNKSMQPQRPPATPVAVSLPYQTQPAQHAPATTDLMCRLCWRQFRHTKPYEYHVQKQLCIKASDLCRFWCEECGAGFTTKAAQQYHNTNAVCGSHVTAPATPKPQVAPISEVLPSLKYVHHPVPSKSKSMETPSPSQDDPYSHLSPQKRAQLDEELRQAEAIYAPRFREAEEMADPMARRSKIESVQNTFCTKQSMIRKKYGVRLRVRRTRAEIEEDKLRIRGHKHGLSSPGPMAETPSAKRQRSGDGSDNSGGPSYISHGPQAQTPIPLPTNHLSVSQMNNSGLGGSTATAATTDPTAFVAPGQLPSAKEQSPPNSLSSLQRKGYRVSSHVGQATQPASDSPTERNGSASTPVVLDDSSDSTDVDEDIPATLPPKKAS